MGFILELHEVEFYGPQQGALNHRLELIFGSRNAGGMIQFKGHGENVLLWKWVDDLTRSAAEILLAHEDSSFDSDLRRLLPAYTLSGTYLIRLLGRLHNKSPNSLPFSHYENWLDIKTSFHRQFVSFTRGESPFDKRYDGPQSAREYWEGLLSVPPADLLALVGLLLSSIVLNSMSEQRTMYTITKLNSPDRSS
ncbi:hypothetical protein RSOLAG22IIIB_08222 [Rhizoctonia solani]|uniref:Uncharacterized protein n=1 Tax=Rhizoctonia solani TaxID=456999 RepID=A0A0K6FSK5_9AGAM|nr:hypothetical protein RSOLAG22IIIB_08222 [Rhizoctonia solani]